MKPYPNTEEVDRLVGQLKLHAQLQHEYGASGLRAALKEAERGLAAALKKLEKLPADSRMAAREPNDLESIQALRPAGPRRLWQDFDRTQFRERLEGALLGRFA